MMPEIRHRSRVLGTVFVATLVLLSMPGTRVHAADYFTEAEIEQIRSAQSLEQRIPVLLKIAEIRLGLLGLVETDGRLDETEEPGGNAITRAIIRVMDPAAAAEIERAREDRPDFENNLGAFTRAELLRGYYQALDETMDNIDDAYERSGRGDVRGALEQLLAFADASLSALGAFDPSNENEEVALEDAIEIGELARDGAREALDVVPQTERR